MTIIIRISARIVLAGAFVILVPRAGYGQERQGVWVGVGGGYGSADTSCDQCSIDAREGSGAAYVEAGWTVSPRLLLGGEFRMWGKEAKSIAPNVNAGLHLYNTTATVTVFPRVSSGMFIKGGLGVSFVDIEFRPAGASIPADLGKGVGLVAGAGYDVPLGERVSLTSGVNAWFGRMNDVTVDRETFVSSWRHNVVEITLGLTFH